MASLSFDFIALATTAVGLVLYGLLRRKLIQKIPRLYFSDLQDLHAPSSLMRQWSQLPQTLGSISLILLALAFIDPHLYFEKAAPETQQTPLPTEGIAIYLTLDKSGSMAEEVVSRTPEGRQKVSKMELMKQVTAEFVKERPNDMIGLVSFARQADVVAPLTIDHQSIQETLEDIERVPTRELDGTAIGYAILKATNLITATQHYAQDFLKQGKPAYEIKNGVIVLVTDGFQDPNPLDYGNSMRTIGVEEAAAYAKEQDIRLYIINVEPKMNTRQYAPHRKVMQRAAEMTGGQFFQANSGESLSEIYAEINSLEKSQLPGIKATPLLYERYSLYPYLVAAGMAALFFSIFLSTTLARRVP